MGTRVATDWDELEAAMAEMHAAGHSVPWLRALEMCAAGAGVDVAERRRGRVVSPLGASFALARPAVPAAMG